ncbi:MAG TPA: DUF3857 domain-containing protein [Xanthomonadaceae bacterium]
METEVVRMADGRRGHGRRGVVPAERRGWQWQVGALLCALCMAWIPDAGAQTFHTGGYQFDVAAPPTWVEVASDPGNWTAPASDDGKGAIWRNWLWDVQIDRRQKRHVEYHDYMYQPITAAMLTNASKYQIGFLPDFETLTLHRVEVLRDGHWSNRLKPEAITLARRESGFESDMATGEVTALLVLEDVRIGDVVRISYTIDGANPVLDGLDADDAVFGFQHPLQRERLRVLFDAGADVVVKRDPRIPAERIEDMAAGRSVTVEQDDLKPISGEGDYPAWFVPAPRVVISQKHSWKDIDAWARGLYPAPKPLPDDLERLIGEWSKLPDPETRTVRALEAVQDQVRYFGLEIGQNSHRPNEPADVWNKREGDCKDKARLLATILGRLGIAAEPALVASNGGNWALDQPPSAAPFDHVIVRAHVAGKTVWLDPTRGLQRGGLDEHAVSDFGYALPLVEGADALVPVARTPSSVAKWRVEERYTPDADGKHVRLEVVTDASAAAAEEMRNRLAQVDRAKLQDQYRDFYGKRFKDVRVAEPIQVRDDVASNRVVVTETYTLGDPWASFDGGVRGLDTEADSIESFTHMPEAQGNRYPVAIRYPVDAEQRIEFDLPRNWHWGGETLQKTIEAPGLSYSLTTGQKDSQVTFVHKYHSTASWIEGNDVGRYADGLRQVNELVSRRFLVSRGDAQQVRDDRLSKLVKDILDNNPSGTSPVGGDKGE